VTALSHVVTGASSYIFAASCDAKDDHASMGCTRRLYGASLMPVCLNVKILGI
jgi:hypothetical protein